MNIEWLPLSKGFGSRWWFKPKKIVVHWSVSYTIESTINTLKNRGLAYHYIIDGTRLVSLVDEKYAAWHAGNYLTNLQSVGVCHVGIWEQPIKEESYATSGQLLAEICKRYHIEPNNETIIGHNSVKATACPGTLDINRLIGETRLFYLGQKQEEKPVPSYPKQVQVALSPGYKTVNVRQEANTTSKAMGNKRNGEIFIAIGDTEGQMIDNNNRWYDTGYGYIWSGATKEV